MRWIGVVVLGIVLGVATASSDVAAGGLEQTPWSRALGMLLNAGFVWAGAAVLAGWLVGSSCRLSGPVAGFVVLACAVGGYYVYGVTLGDRSGLGLGALSGVIRLWMTASVVLGPALGLAGCWTRRRDTLGSLARLVVPVGAALEMLVLRHLNADTFRVDPAMAWTQTMVVALAGAAAVWFAIGQGAGQDRSAMTPTLATARRFHPGRRTSGSRSSGKNLRNR